MSDNSSIQSLIDLSAMDLSAMDLLHRRNKAIEEMIQIVAGLIDKTPEEMAAIGYSIKFGRDGSACLVDPKGNKMHLVTVNLFDSWTKTTDAERIADIKRWRIINAGMEIEAVKTKLEPFGPTVKNGGLWQTEIHEGMEDAPKDRRFLSFSFGRWEPMHWNGYSFSSDDQEDSGHNEFTYWCELPGDPTK